MGGSRSIWPEMLDYRGYFCTGMNRVSPLSPAQTAFGSRKLLIDIGRTRAWTVLLALDPRRDSGIETGRGESRAVTNSYTFTRFNDSSIRRSRLPWILPADVKKFRLRGSGLSLLAVHHRIQSYNFLHGSLQR